MNQSWEEPNAQLEALFLKLAQSADVQHKDQIIVN